MGYDRLFKEFAERVEYYRGLGVNPFSLATGCAVKVDLVDVLYPALKSIRSELEVLGLTIAPRRDADVFPGDPGSLRVLRDIYDVGEPSVDVVKLRAFSPSRAIVLAQVHQSLASGPEPFREVVGRFYSRVAEAVGGKIVVGKGHSIVSAHAKSQFFLVDYVGYEGGEGLLAANNDTIQVIDPAEDPGSPRQAAVAIANSLNDLFTVGAWRNIRVYPVYDAPSEELKGRIRVNMESYVEKLGGSFMETAQPSTGSLLMGATVFAELRGKPPFFYDRVEPGMELLVTRPFGELAIINVYMLAMLDREIAGELESQTGVSVEGLLELKNTVVDLMAKPNVKIARIIEGRLPRAGEDFNPREHIAVTTDVTGPGIYVIKELAELSNVSVRIDDIPLISPILSEFATRNFIIPNATAGTNGAIVILASKQVIEGVEEELRGEGESPVKVGVVVSRGEAKVKAPQKLRKYVAAKSYLKEFELA